jgi:hypothetical protein
MTKMKLVDAVGWLNARYDADVTYQRAYMAGLAGRVPVERDDTGRFWLVDESNLTAMAKALGLTAKPSTKPSTKPKPAARPGPKRSRPRSAA